MYDHKDFYLSVWEDLYGDAFDRFILSGYDSETADRMANDYANLMAMDESNDRIADYADYMNAMIADR